MTEFCELWAETVLPVLGKKASTEREYRRQAMKVITAAFGHLRIEQLDYETVAEWVAKMHRDGIAANTIHNRLNVLGLLFKEAIKRGVIQANANPLPYIDRPDKPRHNWRILTDAEVQLVVNTWRQFTADAPADTRAECEMHMRLWLFALSTAMRRSELLGLRWRRVYLMDPKGPKLEVADTIVHSHEDTPKSIASTRTLPLAKSGAKLLVQQLETSRYTGPDDYVWARPTTGFHFDPTLYGNCLRAVLVKAGLTRPESKRGDTDYIRPLHDLRHTSLTTEAKSGRDPVMIQQRAGHSSFATTQLYIHLAGEQLREGIDEAEALLLGGIEL
jgi:integrase